MEINEGIDFLAQIPEKVNDYICENVDALIDLYSCVYEKLNIQKYFPNILYRKSGADRDKKKKAEINASNPYKKGKGWVQRKDKKKKNEGHSKRKTNWKKSQTK